MLVPILMAFWFGFRAARAGRSALGFALLGALLTFVANTILWNVLLLALRDSASHGIDMNTFIVARIAAAVISTALVAWGGFAWLRPVGRKPATADASTSAGTGVQALR